MASQLVVTDLHYHRNGISGDGYYAGRAEWTTEDEIFRVMFVAFIRPPEEREYEAEGHIAILDQKDVGISFRFEEFEAGLRKFIFSRAGQFLAFPHTLVAA